MTALAIMMGSLLIFIGLYFVSKEIKDLNNKL